MIKMGIPGGLLGSSICGLGFRPQWITVSVGAFLRDVALQLQTLAKSRHIQCTAIKLGFGFREVQGLGDLGFRISNEQSTKTWVCRQDSRERACKNPSRT